MIRLPCRIVNQVTTHFPVKKSGTLWANAKMKNQLTFGHSCTKSHHDYRAPDLPVPLSKSWIYGEGLGGYKRLLVPNLDSVNGDKFILKGKALASNFEKSAIQLHREMAKMDTKKLYEILIVQGTGKAKEVIHAFGIWREKSFRIVAIAYESFLSGHVKAIEKRALVVVKDSAASARKTVVVFSDIMQSYEKALREQMSKLSTSSSRLVPRIQSNIETAKISAANLKNGYLVALPNKLVLIARDNQASLLAASAIPLPIRNGWKSVKEQLPKLQTQIANALQKLQDMINKKFNK